MCETIKSFCPQTSHQIRLTDFDPLDRRNTLPEMHEWLILTGSAHLALH